MSQQKRKRKNSTINYIKKRVLIILDKMLEDVHIEYDVEIYCPSCGSDNIVLQEEMNFYHFSRCNECGYQDSLKNNQG